MSVFSVPRRPSVDLRVTAGSDGARLASPSLMCRSMAGNSREHGRPPGSSTPRPNRRSALPNHAPNARTEPQPAEPVCAHRSALSRARWPPERALCAQRKEGCAHGQPEMAGGWTRGARLSVPVSCACVDRVATVFRRRRAVGSRFGCVACFRGRVASLGHTAQASRLKMDACRPRQNCRSVPEGERTGLSNLVRREREVRPPSGTWLRRRRTRRMRRVRWQLPIGATVPIPR